MASQLMRVLPSPPSADGFVANLRQLGGGHVDERQALDVLAAWRLSEAEEAGHIRSFRLDGRTSDGEFVFGVEHVDGGRSLWTTATVLEMTDREQVPA